MVNRGIILGVWKKVPISLESLSDVHLYKFRRFGLQNNIIIDPVVLDMKSLVSKKEKEQAKKSAEKIKKLLTNGMNIPINRASNYLRALLMETFESLERAIFWFFNYRFNRKHDFVAPSVQAKYYSEFFALIGISRVLGIAVTHVPVFGPVLTEINWKIMKLHFRSITVHSALIAHLRHLGRNIDKFPFIPDDVKILVDEFRPDARKEFKGTDEIISKFLMTDDRESYVYEFNLSSRVFSDFSLHSREFCFIGGQNGRGIIVPSLDTNLEQYSEMILDLYADCGYLKEKIGKLLQLLISILKDMNNQSIDSSLSWLKTKIESFPHAMSLKRQIF